MLPHRPLGASGLEVSALALGSWQTWERIPREAGAAVLEQARECGIDFLEVARYNDVTGEAPIPTGYSEVVFGEIFRRSAWPREEVTVAEKLWWEFWPGQTAAAELDASLERTGLGRVDFLYSDPPPPELALEAVVEAIGGLLAAGRIRAWGVVNWPAERIAAVARIAGRQGVPPPCAAQLPYSVATRSPVEDPEMREALAACGASVVASFALEGGVLSGKYVGGGRGLRPVRDNPRAAAVAERLVAVAERWDATPAGLALAFALASPGVATVLFGATSPAQVTENARAAELARSLSDDQLAELRSL